MVRREPASGRLCHVAARARRCEAYGPRAVRPGCGRAGGSHLSADLPAMEAGQGQVSASL